MSHDLRKPGTGNRLLDYLPEEETARLTLHGRRVNLGPGDVLCRENGPISHVYFPTSGCCCHVVSLEEGRQMEATTIGNEGMIGIHLALGLDFSPLKAVAVVPGEAIRVPVRYFSEVIQTGASLDNLIRKYAAYCLLSTSQTIACNANHTVEQRVCRRMLAAHDRVGKDEFSLTQELLGQVLGVRRQTVTLVARTLHAADFIEYRRGFIKIRNRSGLEAASCDCYRIVKTAYDSIVMN